MLHGLVGVGFGKLILADAPNVTEKVFKPEKDRDFGGKCGRAIGLDHRDLFHPETVCHIDTCAHVQDRIVTVVIAPAGPIPVGHTGTETSLIKSVGILVGVECRLNVTGTHNNLNKNLHHCRATHGSRKPAGAVLVSRSGKLGGSAVSGAMPQQRIVFAVIVHVVISTTIAHIIIDITDKGISSTVKCRKAGSAYRAYRNPVVVLPFDGIKADRLVFEDSLQPMGIVEMFTPAPLIVPHRAVKFGGLTVGEAVVVRGIELAPAVVVLDKVAAKFQYVF